MSYMKRTVNLFEAFRTIKKENGLMLFFPLCKVSFFVETYRVSF